MTTSLPRTVARTLTSTLLLSSLLLSTLAAAQHYTQTNLVSDISGMAAVTDPNLKNPWGLSRSSGSPWWVSDNSTGLSTLYNGTGATQALVVTVPPPKNGTAPSTPSGTVFNGNAAFWVAAGKPAVFLFVTEDGTISGWNPGVDPTNAVLVKDNSKKGAVYKGCTISTVHSVPYFYAANFHSGEIEVYDTNFQRVRLRERAFDDQYIPHDFAPFNVQAIGRNIFVAYAKQDAEKHDDAPGAGLGFVDVYSSSGELRGRLQHGPWLNAPWGVVMTPGEFGVFSHSLLIGNFGSGQVAAYNPVTGRFQGLLKNADNSVLAIDGLWALSFGNNGGAGPSNTLYFSAGPNDEADGLFGTLTPVPAELTAENEP